MLIWFSLSKKFTELLKMLLLNTAFSFTWNPFIKHQIRPTIIIQLSRRFQLMFISNRSTRCTLFSFTDNIEVWLLQGNCISYHIISDQCNCVMVPIWSRTSQLFLTTILNFRSQHIIRNELYQVDDRTRCLLKTWRAGIECTTPPLMLLLNPVFVGWAISMQLLRPTCLKTFSLKLQRIAKFYLALNTKMLWSMVQLWIILRYWPVIKMVNSTSILPTTCFTMGYMLLRPATPLLNLDATVLLPAASQ